MKYTDCNLCGGRNLIFVLKGRDRRVRVDDKREFKLYKCRDCGLIFQNPRLEWEELKYFYCSDDGRQTYYDESNNPILRFFDNFKKKFKKPALWDCGKSGGKFLDIGCDKGLCEKTMIPLYPSWKFYGIEPNENSFMEASRVSGFRVRKGFLEEANFPDDFFNVILINHVLEHVLNPAGTLKECYRILKPGGHLIVAVPNFNCWERMVFGEYSVTLDIPRHLFNFTDFTLNKMLLSIGFKVEKIEYEFAGSAINSLGMRFVKLKKFIKNNFILWPLFGIISLAISAFCYPLRFMMKLAHLTSGFRFFGIKPIK